MTEPDEATLWARENAAKQCDRDREPRIAAAYRQGQYDDDHLKADAEAYRAGQAASAERIKALEEALRKQIALHNSPILNQHLIDAARLEGIRLGLEAAAREAAKGSDRLDGEWREGFKADSHLEGRSDGMDEAAGLIRALDPATIAKEADQ
jgi:hypothetical protein